MRNIGGRVGIAVTISPFTLVDGSVYSLSDVNFVNDQGCWAGKLCQVLIEQYSTNETPPAGSQTSSPTTVLDPAIKYLYVLGTGGGGGGAYSPQDTGSSGGGGGASIHVLTGYTIPVPLQGTPFQVKTGAGGAGGYSEDGTNSPGGTAGGATEILLNGSPALVLGGGTGGSGASSSPKPGGSVSTPNLTRLSPFPSNNEATGGTGGGGAVRNGGSNPSDAGGNNSGRGTGGGGGGGANVDPKAGANGGDASGSDNSVTYNINQQGLRSYTFTNPFPIVVSGCAGTGSVTGNLAQTNTGPTTAPQDPNTGGGGKAGGGLKAVTALGSPSDKFHGGGGGGSGGGIAQSGPYPQANMQGNGGGGYIIVIGSSFELVSGVNF